MTQAVPTVDDLFAAQKRIKGAVIRTPSVAAPRLDQRLGCTVYLKLETLQATGAFKERGAANRIGLLDPSICPGVVTMSAGNHAQAVARHATLQGLPSTIIMPKATPFTKIARTEALGGVVGLVGADIEECTVEAERRVAENGLELIHPFDDPAIIAGQGTALLELLEDRPDVSTLLVPVGGGGLVSGALLAAATRPGVKVIGVEVAGYDSMARFLADGSLMAPGVPGGTLAEGIAVKRPGALPRQMAKDAGLEIITVPERLIELAIQTLAQNVGVIGEGAGVAGLAALLGHPERFAGETVGIPICGGNIDQRLVASILMRGLFLDGRLTRLRFEIDDRPGVLSRITAIIADSGGNVIEVAHGRLGVGLPVKQADLDILVETQDAEATRRLVERIRDAGIHVETLAAG